ncbi:hypothetical protein CUC43_31855 (plasmid) [Bacillus thuringiensis LM1212]|nr:hypothetical protein CUC43_31855 [Bacillus thuringiensis LM1212]
MSYPSDISREKFEMIREELETFSKRTSPRNYDLHDVFNALLYVLSTSLKKYIHIPMLRICLKSFQ